MRIWQIAATLVLLMFGATVSSAPETAAAAFDRWLAQAELGDAEAQFQVGKAYEHGRGRKRHYVLASSFYTKAADQGHPEASYRLARLYRDGLGVSQRPDRAMQWFTKADRAGHLEAVTALGELARDGIGQPLDLSIAVSHFKRAVARNSDPARLALGMMIIDGQVNAPRERGIELIGHAANAGLPAAQFHYAGLLAGDEATAWLQRAADGGFAKAADAYARHLLSAASAQDLHRARGYLYIAASQDFPPAQHRLGVIHGRGEGVEVDHDTATYWFGRAALNGDLESQAIVCMSLARGRGIGKDLVAAAAWCEVAATQGHADAGEAKTLILDELTPAQRKLVDLEYQRLTKQLGQQGAAAVD